MKYLKILLIALFAQPCLAQSDFVEIIKDHNYEALTDADFSYHWDSIPRNVYGQFIVLNFKLKTIDNQLINIGKSSFSAHLGDTKKLGVLCYTTKDLEIDDYGFREAKETGRVNVKYISENNEPVATLVEFTDLYFSEYPQYTYSYQVHFYATGRIELHHGPHNFMPDFIAFTDMMSEMTFRKNNEAVADKYFILSDKPTAPVIYDHLNTPDILAVYDDIVPYTYFPDEQLSYAFDLNELVTGIDDMDTHKNEFTISAKNKQISITQASESHASVNIFTLDGSLILSKDFTDRAIRLDVEKFSQQILVVRIHNERSVLNKKIHVH